MKHKGLPLKAQLEETEAEVKTLEGKLREAETQIALLEAASSQFEEWRDLLTGSVERIDKAGEAMGQRLAQLEEALGEAIIALGTLSSHPALVEKLQGVLNDR